MNVYDRVVFKLKENKDEQYKAFNDKIVVTSYPTIGVRVPVIREIARSIDCEEIEEYLSHCKFDYYETTLIYGFLIARLSLKEMWIKKDVYLSKCDSWGLIDSFVTSLPVKKYKDKQKDEFYNLLLSDIESQTDFALRFRIVALLAFFVGGERTGEILNLTEKLDGKGFYNDMALAWLISVAFVKNRDITFNFLKTDCLSVFTHNKSISKINDSLRVSEYDKKILKTLRK